MKELQPLEANHSKLKEEFCTTAKSPFCCEMILQPFCTVKRISPEASRYLRPTLLDILLQIFDV